MTEVKFAGALLIKDGQILLVQESHKEAHGLWSFPLGHVEENESIEDAAKREVKEETGYDIILLDKKELEIDGNYFKSLHKFNKDKINLTIFTAEIIGGDLRNGDDVMNAKWFLLGEVENLPLRGEWIKFFIK